MMLTLDIQTRYVVASAVTDRQTDTRTQNDYRNPTARRPRAARAPLIGGCGYTSGMKLGEKECFFFQAAMAHTLSRKKNVQKTPHGVATCIAGPHNASRHP